MCSTKQQAAHPTARPAPAAPLQMRRWAPEGGMHMLTGSSKWVNREDVLRRMRKAHTIARRISRREAAAAGGGGAVGSEGALQEQPA